MVDHLEQTPCNKVFLGEHQCHVKMNLNFRDGVSFWNTGWFKLTDMAVSLRSLLNSVIVQASRHTYWGEYLDLPARRWKNCIMSNIFRTPCTTLQGRSNQDDELEGACSTCETKEMHIHKNTLRNHDFDNLEATAKILNYVQTLGGNTE
jgi:hypothetical protein